MGSSFILRANIAPPEKVEHWKKTRVAYMTSNSITRTKHDQKLKEAINTSRLNGGTTKQGFA
jgi:hypothetical protein